MRIAVTGRTGQIAQALIGRAAGTSAEICTVARPEADMTRPQEIEAALLRLQPQAIVNAAAYTDVDLAESEPALAHAINAEGAGAVARAAARLAVPVVQVSTGYVFDGARDRPYREDDATMPLGVYGASKLAGERSVATATPDHVILRTAWVYSASGKSFVRTMLSLARQHDEIRVVRDQYGSPTSALDIAEGILAILRNLIARPSAPELRGVFHMTGGGDASWAVFAAAIFAISEVIGGPSARVLPIPGSDYPAPARRPTNSRLDNSRLTGIHGVRLPHWRQSLPPCIERLIAHDLPAQDTK